MIEAAGLVVAGVVLLASLLKAADTLYNRGPAWFRRIIGVVQFLVYPWTRGARKVDIETLIEMQAEHAKSVDERLDAVCVDVGAIKAHVGIE